MLTLTSLALALAATHVAAAPSKIQARADYCGQWDTEISGIYTVYNNLWGQDSATSGSQCTGVGSIDGIDLAWHTSWSWDGGPYNVKSYANAMPKTTPVTVDALTTFPVVWEWTYAGDDIVANVALDLFLSSTSDGSPEYEIMIWVGALGGAGPISATGSPIGTPTVNGVAWDLYYGINGQMKVYSFVAPTPQNAFAGDLVDFVDNLVAEQSMPTSQFFQTIGAGTEPFKGSNAVFTTTKFSVAVPA